MDEVERVADQAAARRYNDAIRKRRQRGQTDDSGYRARSTSPLTVRLNVNLLPEHVAAMTEAATRAGQSRNRWLQELLDDVFGLCAETDDRS